MQLAVLSVLHRTFIYIGNDLPRLNTQAGFFLLTTYTTLLIIRKSVEKCTKVWKDSEKCRKP